VPFRLGPTEVIIILVLVVVLYVLFRAIRRKT